LYSCPQFSRVSFFIWTHFSHIPFTLLAFRRRFASSADKDCDGQGGRKWSHAHTNTPQYANKKHLPLCHLLGEMIRMDIDRAWQWRVNPFKGRDWGASSVKAPSVQFRGWNAEDNCPGKGSPTPAENACSKLTFLISLPVEIKPSSSGSLLAQAFPQCYSSFTTGSQVF
jgi:hypothetical protein